MPIVQKLTAVVTTVDIGTPVELNGTPLGQGREALLFTPTLPLTSTIKLQTADNDPSTKDVPAEDSTQWTDVVTVTSADDFVQVVEGLKRFVRWNTTVLDADGPNVALYLVGRT